jgi:DNA-binding SARP family transcriptional activator/tetratricopeptide (TPR) repeat protein
MVRVVTLGANDVYGALRKIPVGLPFAALSFLALQRQPVARDKLVELLWDAGVLRAERHSLSQLLYWLKSALPPGTLLTEGMQVGLPNVTDDFTEFFRAFRGKNYVEAVSLYRGAFLDRFPVISESFEEWRTECAAAAESAVVQAYRAIIEDRLSSSDNESIPDLCSRALQIARHDQFFIRARIEALAAVNDVGAALASYESNRQLLIRETGTVPGWMTDDYVRRIEAAKTFSGPSTDYPHAEVPFVGRNEPLRALRHAWQQSSTSLKAVRVVGETGVGKSRLLRHFLRRVALEGARVHLHACAESECLVPYAAIAGLLLSNHREDVILGVPSQLRNALISVVPELSSDTAVTPDLSVGHYHQRVVFEAFVQYFSSAAAKKRLVLAVDDHQWSDDVSRDALNYVIRRLAATGCLFVISTRSDQPSYTTEEVFLDITIDPMRSEEVNQLIKYHEKVYGRVFDSSVIYERTGGNPFFVLQLLRYLNEDPDTTPVSSIGTSVPDSVSRILSSRLDSLSDIARRTATAAAVINHTATVALLATVSGLADMDVANGIDELVRLGILRDGHGCPFVHDLMRQATYHNMSIVLRQVLHKRAAIALANGDVARSELAFHFELGGVSDKAWEHARAAAAEAVRLCAYREADAQFQRMQRCAPIERVTQTQAEYLSFLYRCNRLVDAYPYVEAVEPYAINTSDRELKVLCRLVRSVREGCLSLPSARELIEEAQQACPEQLPKLIRYMFEVVRGSGETDVLKAFGNMLRQEVRGTAGVHRHSAAGLIIGMTEGYDCALPVVEHAVSLAEESQDPAALLSAVFTRGVVRSWAGMCNAALDDYERVLDLSNETGSVDFSLPTACNLAVVYMEQDRLDLAEEWASRALGPEMAAQRPFVAGNLALICYRRGDYQLARKYVEILENSPTRKFQKWIAVQALAFRGLCSLGEADWDLALQIERELAHSTEFETLPVDISTIHEFVGQVIAYRDGAEQAEAYLLDKSAAARRFDYLAGARLALVATRYFQPSSRAERVKAIAGEILERTSKHGAVAVANQASRILQSLGEGDSRRRA